MSDRAAARRSDFVGSKALLKRCFALAKLEYIQLSFRPDESVIESAVGRRVTVDAHRDWIFQAARIVGPFEVERDGFTAQPEHRKRERQLQLIASDGV